MQIPAIVLRHSIAHLSVALTKQNGSALIISQAFRSHFLGALATFSPDAPWWGVPAFLLRPPPPEPSGVDAMVTVVLEDTKWYL